MNMAQSGPSDLKIAPIANLPKSFDSTIEHNSFFNQSLSQKQLVDPIFPAAPNVQSRLHDASQGPIRGGYGHCGVYPERDPPGVEMQWRYSR